MATRPTFSRIQRTIEQLAEALQVRPRKCTIVCHGGEDLKLVAEHYFEECPERRDCEPLFIEFLFPPRCGMKPAGRVRKRDNISPAS